VHLAERVGTAPRRGAVPPYRYRLSDVAPHPRLLDFAGDAHGGCTTRRAPVPPDRYINRSVLERLIVPIEPRD
jgi:hypothetical protein